MTSVAIAGVGCICSLGPSLSDCMAALKAGTRRFGPPTRFPPHCETTQPVFEVPERFLTPWPYPATLPRACRMSLVAARQAIEHGRLNIPALAGHCIGVCLGTNLGVTARYESGQAETAAFLLPRDRFLATNPTHLVANHLGLNGPLQTVANACAAGSDAIGIAAGWIETGVCDAVFAGGTDEITPRVYFGFKSLFINDEHPCRPFDRDRRGLNLGEGAGVFLLASAKFCRAHAITPLGYILGYGAAADADHFTQPRTDGKGLHLAIDEALSDAGVAAEDIRFINAHGTGTPGNDLVESQVLAQRFPGKPFLSTKGYTGHTLGAAGAVEAALTLGCLAEGMLPATAGYTTPDPLMPAHPVHAPTAIDGTLALSETLAFGGSNSVLVIGRGGGWP